MTKKLDCYLNKSKQITKQLLMCEYFSVLSPLKRRIAQEKYFKQTIKQQNILLQNRLLPSYYDICTNINLLPFIPIKSHTNTNISTNTDVNFYIYKHLNEKQDEINIYYYYIKDLKFIICEKTKFW